MMLKPFYLLIFLLFSCRSVSFSGSDRVVVGAERIGSYKPMISGKKLAIVANQTSLTGSTHLVDTLVSLGMDIRVIFAPEHGFRDMADAGAKIENSRDAETGINIISLYGKHFKPTSDDLKDVEIVLFDIQDVGARFYTYISTLHYILEACAENNIKCIVLDRPNPNGFYVDGNIPDSARRSFVCMHPVPVVHGMTIGEYAHLINDEGWLKGGIRSDLEVIRCKNYTHGTFYELPVKPSPNLPNQNSVYLYPSTCFFEGTNLSLGRGTAFPFQVFGSPELPDKGFSFVPESVAGALNPPLKGKRCYGTDLRNAINDKIVPAPYLNLDWIISAYNDFPDKKRFFIPYFDVLSGGPQLREQIISGMTSEQIRETWKAGLNEFAKVREKHLLYK